MYPLTITYICFKAKERFKNISIWHAAIFKALTFKLIYVSVIEKLIYTWEQYKCTAIFLIGKYSVSFLDETYNKGLQYLLSYSMSCRFGNNQVSCD